MTATWHTHKGNHLTAWDLSLTLHGKTQKFHPSSSFLSLPLARHAFSQADSSSGGGVIKIILSAVMSTDFRYCTMLFRLAAYSSKGTCCFGFSSGRGGAQASVGLSSLQVCFLHISSKHFPSTTDSGGVVGTFCSSIPKADKPGV